ncbi:MAG TPA: hypothetical protein VES42_03960, partial [Pilimelia sp.]|nr:hypothetical protein [Pilimelia sp.]
MTPGDLETALRDCLVRGAAQVPASGESAADTVVLADRVLRRARTVRRRRATGGALSVVVVAAAAGVAIAGPGRQAPPPVPHVIAGGSETPQHVAASATPASPPAEPDIVPGTVRREQMASRGLPVDVVVGGRLRTTAGESIDVAGLGEVVAAYRVRDGWLVLGAPVRAGSSLWLVTEGADPRPVLRAVDTVVLAEDGVRLAWRAADRVHVGALVAGEVVATRALAAA